MSYFGQQYPFVCATLTFGRFKGEISYYDSEDYNGNGTAH